MADNPSSSAPLFRESDAASHLGLRTSIAPSPKHPTTLIILAALLVPGVLSYALVTMNESRVVAIMLALLGGGIIIARPYWGLIFFIGLLYTRPEESIAALQGMRLPLLISVVTLVAMVIQKLLNREPVVKSPLNGLIIGFGVSVALSSFRNGNTGEAILDTARLVILVFLIINLVSTESRYRSFVSALLTFGAYLSAYSIYLYFSGEGLARNDVEGVLMQSKATGIFSDPNDLSATIVAGIPLALMRLRLASGVLMRVVYASLLLVMVWAIFLCNSRGGMLALILVIGAFFLLFSRRKVLASILVLVTGMAFFAFGPSRMSQLDTEEESANSRFHFWVNGVEHFKNSPVLGIGYRQFPEINDGMTAHNTFVLCFTETGLVGYFFWMGCLYFCYRRSIIPEGKREAGQNQSAHLDLLGSRLALTGFLAAAFWISRTYVPVLYILLCLPVAQQISSSGFARGWPEESSQQRTRDLARIFLISIGSIILIYTMALSLQ